MKEDRASLPATLPGVNQRYRAVLPYLPAHDAQDEQSLVRPHVVQEPVADLFVVEVLLPGAPLLDAVDACKAGLLGPGLRWRCQLAMLIGACFVGAFFVAWSMARWYRGTLHDPGGVKPVFGLDGNVIACLLMFGIFVVAWIRL